MAVCLIGGAKVAIVAAEIFSVGWTVADTGAEWRRAYQVAPGAILTGELRARNLPAGTDPLPGFMRDGDWYVWRGQRRALPVVSFGSEQGTRDWQICTEGKCQALAELAGVTAGQEVNAAPCRAEEQKP